MSDDLVRTLAAQAGIGTNWTDQKGIEHAVSIETLRAILTALDLPAGSEDDLRNSLSAMEIGGGRSAHAAFATGRIGQPIPLPCNMPPGTPVEVVLQSGGVRGLTSIEGYGGTLSLPPLEEPGYHLVRVGSDEFTVAVAPLTCVTIGDLAAGQGSFGLAAQIYSLRREGDFGIGDFSGMAAFSRRAAELGADAVAISPVHALFSADPDNFSPYSPSSRLFYNPLHADPASLFGAEAVRATIEAEGLGEEAHRLESLKLIDWPAATRAKQRLLRALFDRLQAHEGAMAELAVEFDRYFEEAPELLLLHATFEALHARAAHGDLGEGRPLLHWRDWPGGLDDPNSAAVAEFRDQQRGEIRFHVFLQWLTGRSYAQCQRICREAGMKIGLIADLAIGMDSSGSHAWSRQQDILKGLCIGAPPDYYNANGQNWGLTNFSPRGLAASSFAPVIETLRAVLRHAGGIRIDHVMGLRRLWLVPEGMQATEGAYLAMPSETLFRLLTLESWRHRSVVIGEDLGTLPDGFREELGGLGISGMRVLRFERERDRFRRPDEWNSKAVAMTMTHDLISTAGWWQGADLPPATGAHAEEAPGEPHAVRAWDRGLLWAAFQQAGIAEGERPAPEDPQPVVDAAVRFIAHTACEMKILSVEDALGVPDQPNVPGTVHEKPNWRHRLDGPAEALLDSEAARNRIAILRERS